MKTIRNYIEWIERVRTLDTDGKKLDDFCQKTISLGIDRAEKEANDLEKELFLPPNPIYRIQPFNNGMGTLISEVDIELFVKHANSLGLVKGSEGIQGGDTRVLRYTLDESSFDSLYISENINNPKHESVRFRREDGKWSTYRFKNHSTIWICAYTNKRIRTCHDSAQPFLELVDVNQIPSVITTRERYVGASNIPIQDWKDSNTGW